MGVKDLAKRGSVIVLAQNIVALTFLNPITRWPSFRGYSPSEFTSAITSRRARSAKVDSQLKLRSAVFFFILLDPQPNMSLNFFLDQPSDLTTIFQLGRMHEQGMTISWWRVKARQD